MSDLLSKLEAIHFRFIEVGKMITDPDIISDMDRFVKLSKEYRELEELESYYKRYSNVLSNLSSGKALLKRGDRFIRARTASIGRRNQTHVNSKGSGR